jgi:hypothetical protein
MDFKLVYGNHGRNPFHIMDTLLLVRFSLEALGHKADLEEQIVPGKTNILIECFTAAYVETMREARQTPGTDFIVIATEFLTGQTFNDFEAAAPQAQAGQAASHYDNADYWRERFQAFLAAQRETRAIWHLADSQVEPFRAATQHPKVGYLPHGYVDGFARVRHKADAHKDIDALFTGHLTEHRRKIIGELQQLGINALATQPLNFPQREDLVARSKIALNLKQNPSWQYPSNSRFHYHLSNDSLLLSEHCPVRCDLSPYVEEAPVGQLAGICRDILSAGHWQDLARQRKERFRAERPMTVLMQDLLDVSYSHL